MVKEVLNSSTTPFSELASESIAAFERRKRPRLRTFSQGVNLPDVFSRSVKDAILNNLPDYISDDVRHQLDIDHPPALITLSLLYDQRLFGHPHVRFRTDWEKVRSDFSTSSVSTAYRDGQELLSEVTLDFLFNDILRQTKGKYPTTKTEKLLRLIPIVTRKTETIAAARFFLENIYEDKTTFRRFKNSLVKYLLTGDGHDGDKLLDTYILEVRADDSDEVYSIEHLDDLAIFMGTNLKNYWTKVNKSILKNYSERAQFSWYAKGIASKDFPGVISLAGRKQSLQYLLMQIELVLGSGFVSSMQQLEFFSLIANGFLAVTAGDILARSLVGNLYTVIHEYLHYFSFGDNHFALTPGNWRKND